MADDPSKRGLCRSSRRRRRAADVDVYTATGTETDSPEGAGTKIISDVSGATPNIVRTGDLTFFAGSRRRVFLRLRRHHETVEPRQKLHASSLGSKSPWTGVAIDHRLAFLLEGGHSPSDRKPHTDILDIGEYYQVPVMHQSQAFMLRRSG